VVEAGLRMLLRLKRQEDILSLVGKVHWEANWTRAVSAETSVILVDSSVWIDLLNNVLTERSVGCFAGRS
jgi:hypothetical protein